MLVLQPKSNEDHEEMNNLNNQGYTILKVTVRSTSPPTYLNNKCQYSFLPAIASATKVENVYMIRIRIVHRNVI